ncbi:hypothetical protein P280DRAFT_504420 [Massarina eburnea CBS 473.64]|uniref:Rhodopsin domain-containing protein n=1 Tax=Massarina eburnea CBS 473.64 TaxID=1395130 RepID=A0A6A6SAP3_9PLEO|nr:hypothetical protein P280DRAFT_504420 [Massarina eburnea CBS 473.64]
MAVSATAVHGSLAVAIAFAFTSLSTVIVALRFYSRYYLVRKLSSPDWVMLAGLISTWCCAVVTYYNNIYSDYSHVYDLESYSKVASGGLLMMFLFRFNYMLDHLLIKLSILLFYKCIAASNKSFHRIVNALIAVVTIASLVMMFFSIFLCHHVSDAWSIKVFLDQLKGIRANCLNPTTLWLFNGSFNLATDAIIWLLPIPFFLHLRSMPIRRRLELSAIFGLGILAITASAVRLWILTRWLSNWNEAGMQFGNLLIWSQVEQHAGIIAGSIPFLRPLVKKLMRATHCRENEHNSPGPAAKLIGDNITPDNPVMPRTPIIPSPAPTFGSDRGFRAPSSPLSPISPVQPNMLAIHTV